jgi:hypothetical protein
MLLSEGLCVLQNNFFFSELIFLDPKQPAVVPIPNSHGLLNSAKSGMTHFNVVCVVLASIVLTTFHHRW